MLKTILARLFIIITSEGTFLFVAGGGYGATGLGAGCMGKDVAKKFSVPIVLFVSIFLIFAIRR